MGLFITIPAILSIVLASLALETGNEWLVWFIILLVSSAAVVLFWPILHWMWQRNIGQWLSSLVLLALPGSIIFGIVQVARYGFAGGAVIPAAISLIAWIVLGLLSGFVIGRLVTSLYGFLE